jgi:Mn-dependent DtxR family transcriptional regulator
MKRENITALLTKQGISSNSISGILERAQRDKLAKSDGNGTWQLTDKGRQQQAASTETT